MEKLFPLIAQSRSDNFRIFEPKALRATQHINSRLWETQVRSIFPSSISSLGFFAQRLKNIKKYDFKLSALSQLTNLLSCYYFDYGLSFSGNGLYTGLVQSRGSFYFSKKFLSTHGQRTVRTQRKSR